MAKAAADVFAKFPDLLGSSREPGYVGWIPVFSFNWGYGSNSVGRPSGKLPGAALICSMSLAHDTSTPRLMEACLKGEAFDKVMVDHCRRVGKALRRYAHIVFKDVVLSSVLPVGQVIEVRFTTSNLTVTWPTGGAR